MRHVRSNPECPKDFSLWAGETMDVADSLYSTGSEVEHLLDLEGQVGEDDNVLDCGAHGED
jgi:hypothetical protein